MKKLLLLPILMLLLLVGLSSATLYESVSQNKLNIRSCDSNLTNIISYENGAFLFYDANYSTSSVMLASSVQDYKLTHFYDNNNTIVTYYQDDNFMRFFIDDDDVDVLSDDTYAIAWNTSLITDIEMVGNDFYVYENSTNKLKKYSFAYTYITGVLTVILTPTSTIYVFPDITGQSIHYNLNDNRMYYYDNVENKTYVSDINGNLITSFDVEITSDTIYNICYSNKWFFVDSDNSKLYSMTSTLPDGTYQLIDGVYYASQTCVDETTLCLDTQYIDNGGEVEVWCDIDDSLFCDALCSNQITTIDLIDVTVGYCEEATCTSECSFNGFQECLSPNSYRRCGQYDVDLCLEYGPETQCIQDFYCSNTGYCTYYNYSSDENLNLALPNFYVKPLIEDTTTQSVIKDSTDTINVKTSDNLYIQKNALLVSDITQSYFKAYDCNYKENIIYNLRNNLINDSFDLSINAQDKLSTTSFVIDFNGSNEVNISLTDNLNDVVKLYTEYNDTTFNLLVYEQNATTEKGRLLINDTGFKAYDDLEYIELTITLDFDTLLYDVFVYVERFTPLSYQVKPLSFYDWSSIGFYQLLITSNNNITMSDIYSYTVLSRPSYSSLKLNDYSEVTCTYSQTGCYTIRQYVMGVDYSIFNNYEETKVCLNSVSSTPVSVSSKSLNDMINDFDFLTQMIILLVLIIVTSLIFFVVGESNTIKTMVGTGVISLEIIYFIIIGTIPLWILILVFILVGLITTGILRKVFFGE